MLDGDASLAVGLSIGDLEPPDGRVAPDGPISRTLRRVANISSSVKTPKGSRLLLIVPLKSVGSISV